MTVHTCQTCAYCGPDTDEAICHKRLSAKLVPCGSWKPRGGSRRNNSLRIKKKAAK